MAKTKVPVKQSIPPATNPNGVKSVYVNNMEFLMNSLEARLNFNEIIPGAGPLTVERRASVVMSLPHFLAMAQVMHAQTENVTKAVKDGLEAVTAAINAPKA
jgi:hypothetical protein